MKISPWKKDFPLLYDATELAYLDSAATSQKPKAVLEAVQSYYAKSNANIHRGVYKLSQESTKLYEDARKTVADFLHTNSTKEIIFTKGATESINLVAATWGEANITAGDEIILSEMEHHANIVPWQELAKKKKALIKYIPVRETGELDLEAYKKILSPKTKIVSVVHISNTLGTINPVTEITKLAKEQNAVVLIDGCQAVQHLEVQVNAIGCDFYVFSGHKLYAPTGIGVLWGRLDLLKEMPVYQTGGDMITSVTKRGTTFAQPPAKFEAGTPPIAQAIGLAAAINYLQEQNPEELHAHEQKLLQLAVKKLREIPAVKMYANFKEKAPIISFSVEDIHPHDLGTILDEHGVAVRTGQHCTQILMDRFEIPATTRASFAFYNTEDDVNKLVTGVKQAIKLLRII